jgi:hypothetical protein
LCSKEQFLYQIQVAKGEVYFGRLALVSSFISFRATFLSSILCFSSTGSSGADPNLKVGSGQIPLAVAIIMKHKDGTDLLIKAGSDIESVASPPPLSYQGATTAPGLPSSPLALAISSGNLEIIQLLLDSGVNVDKSGHEGKTPLIHAIEHGNLDAVKLLIASGADIGKPQMVDKPWYTPFCTALDQGETEIVSCLFFEAVLKSCDMLATDTPNPSNFVSVGRIIHKAARIGYAEAQWLFSQLLLNGFLPCGVHTELGMDWLRQAASNDHAKATEQLSEIRRERAKCVVCGIHAKKKCRRCRLVRYCGYACSRLHWTLGEHKRNCSLN